MAVWLTYPSITVSATFTNVPIRFWIMIGNANFDAYFKKSFYSASVRSSVNSDKIFTYKEQYIIYPTKPRGFFSILSKYNPLLYTIFHPLVIFPVYIKKSNITLTQKNHSIFHFYDIIFIVKLIKRGEPGEEKNNCTSYRFLLGICLVGLIVYKIDSHETEQQHIKAQLNATTYGERMKK